MNAEPLAWSPDGDRLLIATDRGLESIPALGGASRLLVPGVRFGTWSSDGRRIAFVGGDSLMIRDENGRSVFLTRSIDPHSPAWSPDGKWIAFVSGNAQWFQGWNIAPSSLWLVPAAGGEAIQLTGGNAMVQSPAWAPDGRRLLFVSNRNGTRDIYQLDLEGDGHPSGDPIQLTHGLNASLISLTPDGKTLGYSVATDHSNVWSLPVPARGWASSRDATLVTTDRERIENFDISRDGKWLVFDSDRSGLQQLFRVPLAGGEVQQITHDTVPAFGPSLSPDGSEVAYHVVSSGGLRRVFETTTDGSGVPVQVSPGGDYDEVAPDWSPDGKRIAWVKTSSFVRWVSTDFATRTGGRWSAPEVARGGAPGDTLWQNWVDSTSLLGVDSAGRLIAVSVAGPRRRQALTSPGFGALLYGGDRLSADGRSLLIRYMLDRKGEHRSGIYQLTLDDRRIREVLRFDDPLHPHRPLGNIAEQGGRLYFTLESPESSVWTVSIAGLAR